VDVALNETGRIVTGLLKPTPVDKIYSIAGIAPHDIRRTVSAEAEKQKQLSDPRHSLHGHIAPPPRLKSRRSFLQHTRQVPPEERKRELWSQQVTNPLLDLKEELPPGANLPFSTWRSLNRLRSGVTRCRYNLKRWGYVDDELCDCGAAQTNAHLLTCGQLQQTCTQNDLPDDRALYVTEYWKFKA
jgi:hypothetical protein